MTLSKKETIFVIGAHSDDFAIGAGGTLLKYVAEKKKVISLVASFGENSHPHLQAHYTVKFRKKETQDCCHYMGIHNAGFIGIKENFFLKEENPKKIHDTIKKAILKYKPSKIFSHSIDDPHPDHRALYKITLDVVDELDFAGEFYTYDIWNPFNLMKQEQLKLVVDITPYLWRKIAAIRYFKSQWVVLIQLIPATIVRALRHGLPYKHRYAEVFYRVR